MRKSTKARLDVLWDHLLRAGLLKHIHRLERESDPIK